MTAPQRRAIYPARRAIEHATAMIDVRPLRLFPVLWPLWQVEIVANVEDPQSYEVLDRFVTRTIAEGGATTTGEIAHLLGLNPTLVESCLRYLIVIGHVDVAEGRCRLTRRGTSSLADGKRYVAKESRQQILIDRMAACPLPRSHYDSSVTVVAQPRIDADELGDRTRFTPLYSPAPFRENMIHDLVALPNRNEFNVATQLTDVRVVQVQPAFLPVYLIETTQGLLAYTSVSENRDVYFEELCRRSAEVRQAVRAETTADPTSVWHAWLTEQQGGRGNLEQLPNGVWRATLPSTAFERPHRSPSRVGSFEVRDRLFLQLWCDDQALRRRALLDRALAIARTRDIATRAALLTRVAKLAGQLEVPPVTFAEIERYSMDTAQHDRLARLHALG